MIFTDTLEICEAGSRSELVMKLIAIFTQLSLHSSSGSSHFICSDNRNLSVMLKAGEVIYGELRSLIVWVKSSGQPEVLGQSGHDLILAFEREDVSSEVLDSPSRLGRYLPDVWLHDPAKGLCSDTLGESMLGPAIRPTALIADAIGKYCKPDSIILDSFCGSGTVLIAAQKTGRRARAIEANCRACDQAIRRWQLYTGQEAIYALDGRTFEAISNSRSR